MLSRNLMLSKGISYGKEIVITRRPLSKVGNPLQLARKEVAWNKKSEITKLQPPFEVQWRFAIVEQSLWKETIMTRYGMEDFWTIKAPMTPFGVGLWRSIRNLWPKILKNPKIRIENGKKTLFWDDIWIGQHSLKSLFLDLYILSHLKNATVMEVRDNLGWNFIFRRLLNDWEVDRLTEFYKTLK